MEQPQQQTLETNDEATLVVSGEETTLVAPRFDNEETLVARPVVPLEGDAHAPAQDHTAARPAHGYRRPFAPRRAGMLALALVSVLVGGVLGGAGLYLYQRQSQDPAVSPAETTTQPAAESQAAPPAEVPAQHSDAQATDATQAEEPAAPEDEEEAPSAAPAREPESVPAAARRDAPAEGDSTGTPKRGKKGERDEVNVARATPRPGGNVARADEPEARQVDTIFYRQRRAERRAERRAARRARRDDAPDRLRRIFEGAPE